MSRNGLPVLSHFGMDKGEVFRIIVLNARGKTTVIVEENFGLPSTQFPGFLKEGEQLLKSLRFAP